MKIHRTSFFKYPENDLAYFDQWVKKLEMANGRTYYRQDINTGLGKTVVWSVHPFDESKETLIIFPGARTTPLIWDFDRGLDPLLKDLNVYLIETNGLPNPSDGNTPDIKTLDYGHWAAEIIGKLGVKKCYIAGASFGGLICAKLGITNPELIKGAFLLNPGCFRFISMGFTNLYYNLLPIVSPTEANVRKFLDKVVFSKPNHCLSVEAEQLLVDYEVFAISRYIDKTQKPYFMGNELKDVRMRSYLLFGTDDLLIPYEKSKSRAEKLLKGIEHIEVFENVGHGIEAYAPAIEFIAKTISDAKSN
jgi:pimeloyl-ACP methyl ester carboxylesterase